MAKKKYDISFGIYDVENEDWITDDADMRIEFDYAEEDFNPLIKNIIQLIEEYNEDQENEEKEEDQEEETKGE